jgi:hypothetical protein
MFDAEVMVFCELKETRNTKKEEETKQINNWKENEKKSKTYLNV